MAKFAFVTTMVVFSKAPRHPWRVACAEVPKLFLCLFLVFAGTSLEAASVSKLYQASAPVAGPNPDDRNDAIKEALGAVLVKVTGSRDAPKRPEARNVIERGPSLVQEFSFEMAPGSGADEGERRLSARFDEAAVDTALREAGIPVWGGTRPALLLWIATEDGAEQRLATPEEQPWVWEAARETFAARGLPLVVPLFDLEDRKGVRPGDLWGGYSDVVRMASERYAPDAILVGTLKSKGEQWSASWVLIQGDTEVDWSTTGDSPQRVVEEGVHWAGDQVAARYAPAATSQAKSRVRLVLSDVHSLSEYGRAMGYLGSLDVVTRAFVELIDGSRMDLDLDVRGGAPVLRQVIARGSVLEADDASKGDPGDGRTGVHPPAGAAQPHADAPVLSYRLRP